ncbi:PBSX family phage terminase large subunit [Salibacterium salarium]|uniref:PBSX family phage terminase large subunit n=1 Tax=Salibacterium salarium TaxID=284579 RepID=UPI00277D3573|nr:PBSX family phage terminase large subunit [Salibacterium salarium]MDQ0299651.1 PBSX family phage terminase large subunit [Salibacterium salarium]
MTTTETKKKPALFKFEPFSKKQKKVLTWWHYKSPVKDKDGIICDGSVRAGKTVVMSLSYVMWGMESFNDQNLGMAGKTIGSFRRNVIRPLKRMLKSRGYRVKDHRADNFMTISYKGKTNYFYIFGGKDEGSQDLIQGITLAGMFFDEVALMPDSFVNQAEARCSVGGSKFWYNCNPESPYHWFKENYLDNLEEKRLVHLHFRMEDNPSLDKGTIARYKRMFSGVFYERFILGLWVLAEGVIFDMFDKKQHAMKVNFKRFDKYYVSADYGTQNPTAFGLWGLRLGVWYKLREYHYDGRKENKQKTPQDYLDDLLTFTSDIRVTGVVVDPSATPFIALLKNNRFRVIEAKNEVLEGIQNMANALREGEIYYDESCKETFREFSSYIWDEKAGNRGEDKPIKANDHHMDADRYFVNTIIYGRGKKSLKERYKNLA